MEKNNEKDSAGNLFRELTSYERKGLGLKLGDDYASPMQVVQASMLKENRTLMREYIFDEKGDIDEVHFRVVYLDAE